MTQPPHGTVGELGEFGLIDLIRPLFTPGDGVIVGPGDDSAVVSVADGRSIVSTDLLLEGRHFRRDWSEAPDVGHKAAAVNLSDINAMGGRATGMLIALGVPADTPVAWVLDFASGVAAENEPLGVSMLGGDVTAADSIVVAVTVLGVCEGEPVRRSGAQAGDVVAVCGRLGWAAAGYHVLGRGFRSPRAVVEAHRRPEVPYAAGPEAAALGATAMIDLSDGLLGDLGHVARASGVHIDVHTDAFTVDGPLQAVGAALGVDPLNFILTGGEDFALAATFPQDVELPDQWRVVGEVSEGEGVTVDGASYENGPLGHEHFR